MGGPIKMKRIIVIAPHPDDETLGCGGSLLRHVDKGDEIHWLIVSGITEGLGFTYERKEEREQEIEKVSKLYGFKSTTNLKFPTTRLDSLEMGDIVGKIGAIFKQVQPEVIYLPYPGDVHTDHRVVFDAAISCSKWFRYPSIERILAYETLSETDFGLNPDNNSFRPNVYIDITDYLDKKIEIMNVYKSEMLEFPFPRSIKAIRSLAFLRGAGAGYQAAESFMLLKERWS
jgi:LmbE family N-acetylglucosaminyl deacetylase